MASGSGNVDAAERPTTTASGEKARRVRVAVPKAGRGRVVTKTKKKRQASSDDESSEESAEDHVESESDVASNDGAHEEVDRGEAHEQYPSDTFRSVVQLRDLEVLYTPLASFDWLDSRDFFAEEDVYLNRNQIFLRGVITDNTPDAELKYPVYFPAIGKEYLLDQMWFVQHGSISPPDGMIELEAKDYCPSTVVSTNSKRRRVNVVVEDTQTADLESMPEINLKLISVIYIKVTAFSEMDRPEVFLNAETFAERECMYLYGRLGQSVNAKGEWRVSFPALSTSFQLPDVWCRRNGLVELPAGAKEFTRADYRAPSKQKTKAAKK
jgi:hypothetical protein